MPYNKPGFSTTEHNPVFGTPPLIFADLHGEEQDHAATERAASVASSAAAERENAFLRALNAPTARNVQPPSVRQPNLSSGFAEALDHFDDEIHTRGVAI